MPPVGRSPQTPLPPHARVAGGKQGPGIGYAAAAAVLYKAGFRGDDLAKAVAIGAAESRLNPNAQGKNVNGTVDTGLMQINSVHGQDPERMKDPQANADFAYTLYKRRGNKFGDWVAYNTGTYLLWLPGAKGVADFIGKANGPNSLGPDSWNIDLPKVPNPLEWGPALAKALDTLGKAEFWKRVGMALLGVVALALAVAFIGREFATSTVTRAVRGM